MNPEADVDTIDRMASSQRSYGQACPLALSMDILGERWTMLIIRELLLGPKRFTELGNRLDGTGPNRLSQRLRMLQNVGLLSKTVDGRYALTAYGEGLRTPVIGLAIWGMGLLAGDPDVAEHARPDMVALCMTAALDQKLLKGLDFDCEVDAGDQFTISVRRGDMSVSSGSHGGPTAHRVRCTGAMFLALTAGQVRLDDAVNSDDIELEGSLDDLRSMFDMFAEVCRAHGFST